MSKQTKDQEQEYRITFRGLLDLYLPYKTYEAEKALGLSYDRWTRELRAICERDRRCIESATASQRAEAFLRTIGKWEEAK